MIPGAPVPHDAHAAHATIGRADVHASPEDKGEDEGPRELGGGPDLGKENRVPPSQVSDPVFDHCAMTA
jgi:hypothetical protein